MQDRWGNYMEINYDRSISADIPHVVEIRPSNLKYTGNLESPQLPTTREVSCSYQAATVPHLRRVAKIPIRNASLISSITVSAEDRVSTDSRAPMRWLRRYDLTYRPATAGLRTVDRLEKLTECYYAALNLSGEA